MLSNPTVVSHFATYLPSSPAMAFWHLSPEVPTARNICGQSQALLSIFCQKSDVFIEKHLFYLELGLTR